MWYNIIKGGVFLKAKTCIFGFLFIYSLITAVLSPSDLNKVCVVNIESDVLSDASAGVFLSSWNVVSNVDMVRAIQKANINRVDNLKLEYDEIFWIGDSRAVGLDMFCDIAYFGEVGCGINYFYEMEDEIYEIKNKNVVINLGVNDLDCKNKYINLYSSFPDEFVTNNNIIILSVNPCDGDYSDLNSRIKDFNYSIKVSLPDNIEFIDSYNYLWNSGFDTTDGLHYTGKTYRKIYDYVNEQVFG